MAQHLDIPPYFYGELIRTTARVVTWNVWGLYGPWQEREAAIASTLQEASPDLLVLTESWAKGDDSQCERLAVPLGLPYHAFSGVPAQEDESALSGVAVLSSGSTTSSRPRRGGAEPDIRGEPPCLVLPPWPALIRRITTRSRLISVIDRMLAVVQYISQ